MKTDLNVVCTKWGDLYGPEYVNRLYRSVLRNTQRRVNFFCVTNEPHSIDPSINCVELKKFPFHEDLTIAQSAAPKKNGAFKKVAMFEPGLLPIKGPVLAFDLDVIISGSIDALADFSPGHVTMPPPFSQSSKRPTLGEGSVIKFDPELHSFLFEDLAKSTASMVHQSRGSEQSYTSASAHKRGLFSTFPKDWVVSFKRHCRPSRPMNLFSPPRLPDTAKVVCFHGSPSIEDAINGFASDLLHRTKPAPWISQHWK